MKRLLLLLLVLSAFVGCSQPEPLVIYTEPMWEEEVRVWAATFTIANKIPCTIVTLSSEVSAQQIRYHQPVDVWLMADARMPSRFGISERVEGSIQLRGDTLVKVACIRAEQAQKFRSDSCWVIPASDTPMDLMLMEWRQQGLAADSCTLVANFHAQQCDYLLRGWARGGYCWSSFARLHPEQLRVLERGPGSDSLWVISKVATGRNPEAAAAFLEHVRQQR